MAILGKVYPTDAVVIGIETNPSVPSVYSQTIFSASLDMQSIPMPPVRSELERIDSAIPNSPENYFQGDRATLATMRLTMVEKMALLEVLRDFPDNSENREKLLEIAGVNGDTKSELRTKGNNFYPAFVHEYLATLPGAQANAFVTQVYSRCLVSLEQKKKLRIILLGRNVENITLDKAIDASGTWDLPDQADVAKSILSILTGARLGEDRDALNQFTKSLSLDDASRSTLASTLTYSEFLKKLTTALIKKINGDSTDTALQLLAKLSSLTSSGEDRAFLERLVTAKTSQTGREQFDRTCTMAKEKNFYVRLGLQRDATPQQIRRAYLNLTMIVHPDHNSVRESAATKATALLTEAYETLSDQTKRRAYDSRVRNEK